MLTNEQIAAVIIHMADALEEQEENPYRIRAYRRAANALKRWPQNVSDLVHHQEDLTVIPKIGKKLAGVIKEIVLTENLDLRPKFHDAQIPKGKFSKNNTKLPQFRIYSLIPILESLFKRLKNIPEIERMECAGDFRRKKDLISMLDIVISTEDVQQVFKKISAFPSIKYLIKTEKNFLIVQLKRGIHITFHAISNLNFSEKLLKITGSKNHYEIIKNKAKVKKISLLSFTSEELIYKAINLQYIPPELRENTGEIQAAEKYNLPKLIELQDIKGDLHCHTNETDGSFTLEEMVDAAREMGYEYLAITDHSKSLRITNGMNEKRLLQQIKKIDALNEKLNNFTILKSMEVDILENGMLDLSDDVLKELDLTVCSIHSKFHFSSEKQTERIIRAMDNPYFTILGHATGRLMTHRPPYPLDFDAILKAAKERGCFIEVNAQPARLDINDINCRKAKEAGVKVAISSDAHTTHGFNFMVLGVNQARRGWLEANDVINTFKLSFLKKLLKRK